MVGKKPIAVAQVGHAQRGYVCLTLWVSLRWLSSGVDVEEMVVEFILHS
jgi:hypothetical protein